MHPLPSVDLHPEIYADAAALQKLPAPLVIDHLGMTEAGLPVVLETIDAGAKVKAAGFGRVQMDVPQGTGGRDAAAPCSLGSTSARGPRRS